MVSRRSIELCQTSLLQALTKEVRPFPDALATTIATTTSDHFHANLSFTVEAKDKVAGAVGAESGKAEGTAQQLAGEAKGKAAELKGQAKGKAEEIKGKM